MTLNPFSSQYDPHSDEVLIQAALAGSGAALEQLVSRHQHYLYNIALKMCLSPFDAEDLTQEVLLKAITHLSQFQGRSSFRTWLYRIAFNHFLKMKKKWLEVEITSFEAYGRELDALPDADLSEAEQMELREYVDDAKIGCMSGMLLCLDRPQRLVYVLGEIFGIDHRLGAELLDISPDNFRQRLSRARRDLYQFMNRKCGLINHSNPCRCDKKTKAFIQAGWVDADRLKFNTSYLKYIHQVAPAKSADLCSAMDEQYADLFREQPFQEKAHLDRLRRTLFQDENIARIFDFPIKPS